MTSRSHKEQILKHLTDSRNRSILTILHDAARPLHVTELTEQLVARETTIINSSDYEDALDRVRISLHHKRLPKLAEAGLLEYDRNQSVVTVRDSTTVDATWIDVDQIDNWLARLQTGSRADEQTIGILEGREDVIEHGRHLADVATDDLFCMYVSDDLLEEECIRRAEDAIRRGVDIYLGSQNPTVRDLTRKHLPEATVWEPQLDVMNARSQYPRVGRFVFADREKIMLALIDEPDADGTSRETAMIGEGKNNPLVVLARELLGSRLDHLDYQSETLQDDLPFEL